MKSTIKLGVLVGALCGLNNLNADVPHVFEDGEVIRAEEMNENFASINSEITTIKADVENNSGSSWSEDYSYSRKEKTPGRDRVTVLGVVYDIMQFDTVSFYDHDLFTIKLPKTFNYGYSWSDEYYPRTKDLDSHNSVSVTTRERRNYEDSLGYTHSISGFPANVSVSVNNYHVTDTFNAYKMTRAEFDAATYTEYYFFSDFIRISYVDANPYEENSETPETNWFDCDADWSAVSTETYWKWNVTTGTSDEDSITSIDDFNSILNACKAAESEAYAIKQRVNKYFAYTTIGINAQIALDAHTILSVGYGFDEQDYSLSLGTNCGSFDEESQEAQDCDASVAALDRNFSDDFAEEVKLPAKLTREQYVDQLFTLLDHIVIADISD